MKKSKALKAACRRLHRQRMGLRPYPYDSTIMPAADAAGKLFPGNRPGRRPGTFTVEEVTHAGEAWGARVERARVPSRT